MATEMYYTVEAELSTGHRPVFAACLTEGKVFTREFSRAQTFATIGEANQWVDDHKHLFTDRRHPRYVSIVPKINICLHTCDIIKEIAI